ncbi:REV1 [Symbiodinium sp. CCMP2592]|nr:REV1 [Symbiodinium sp. CCMP2592]
MGRGKKQKNVGSCGMYLFLDDGEENYYLLVHRRSKQVSESNMISAPGGIVEKWKCGDDGSDIVAGARQTALEELREETGFVIREEEVQDLFDLPVSPEYAWWGEGTHFNFGYVCYHWPEIPGPERDSLHEVIWGGMGEIGTPAGDGYHSWVNLHALLENEDLMPACRKPCEYFLEIAPSLAERTFTSSTPSKPVASTARARVPAQHRASAVPRMQPSSTFSGALPKSAHREALQDEESSRPLKRPKGSVGRAWKAAQA